MRKVPFGNTGMEVSRLGFGCMRLPVLDQDNSRIDEAHARKMVHHAIEHGVNYFDTAYPYHGFDFSKGGASEPFIGRALKGGYRDRVYVATKLPSWLIHSRKDMDRILDEQLQRLDTDVIDFYLLHGLDTSYWKNLSQLEVLEFLNRALKSGKIRYAGFSFHDEADLFREIVDAYDWSFCQIQYNYMDEEYQAGREGLMYAAERGMAVVAMEPLRGGTLVKGLPPAAREILERAAPERSAAGWALQWLWERPEVTVVLSGMSHLDQLKENLQLAMEPDGNWSDGDEEVLREAVKVIRGMKQVDCTSCGYCLPCPEGVNIPRNFALYNDHHMLRDPAAKLRYQRLLSETAKASNCIQCGECEPKCPQGIPIPEELERVDAVLRA